MESSGDAAVEVVKAASAIVIDKNADAKMVLAKKNFFICYPVPRSHADYKSGHSPATEGAEVRLIESPISTITIAVLTSACAVWSITATARVLPHSQFHGTPLSIGFPSGFTVSRSSACPHFAQAIDFIMALPRRLHSTSVSQLPVSASVLKANRYSSVFGTGVCPMAITSEGCGRMVAGKMMERLLNGKWRELLGRYIFGTKARSPPPDFHRSATAPSAGGPGRGKSGAGVGNSVGNNVGNKK